MPPRAGQEYITDTEIRALNTAAAGEPNSPAMKFDNAGQTALILPEVLPVSKQAKTIVSDMFSLDGAEGAETARILHRLNDYHSNNVARFTRTFEMGGKRPEKLPRGETQLFYSLIYHMLGTSEQPAAVEARADIRAAFEIMHLGEPLSFEQVQARKEDIESLIAPKQKKLG